MYILHRQVMLHINDMLNFLLSLNDQHKLFFVGYLNRVALAKKSHFCYI